MSTTQTKKLSEATVVQSVADADKIPIVNSSGQTVLVPLSGLLGAVKVGGRNYLRQRFGSSSMTVSDGKAKLASITGDNYLRIVASADCLKSQETVWTFSCDCEGLSEGSWINFKIDRTNAEIKIAKNGRCHKTFTADPSTVIAASCTMMLDDMSKSITAEDVANVSLSHFKLEVGNIPTDWSPAPEDWGGGKTLTLSGMRVCCPTFKRERRVA